MIMRPSVVIALCWLAFQQTRPLQGAEVAYGHPDFYPSPERPVGYRGDGNGYFPGARLLDGFWEGTPTQIEISYKDMHEGQERGQKTGTAWDVADDKTHNIVWKTRLPAWANTQPLVVGDLVFTTAEPDRLVCLDARTGTIRWAARANPWEIANGPSPAAAAAQRLSDIYRDAHLRFGESSGTMSRLVRSAELKTLLDPYLEKGLPRIVAALEAADPATDWKTVAAKHADGLKRYQQLLKEREDAGTLNARNGLDHDKPIEMGALGKAIEQRLRTLCPIAKTDPKTPGPMLDAPWDKLVGFACPVPISDGERIYASFGQGQTVCYTLDGKRVWAVYREQQRHGSRMAHAQSLRLADGVLVDTHGGSEILAGLDAKTGKLLWEAPTLGAGEFGKKGGYYVANHAVMPLKDGDKTTSVLITSRNNIIRIRDGKVLGALPFTHGTSGGPSLSFSGNILYRVICGDNTRSPLAAFRLSLAGDAIEAEKLWETPGEIGVGYQGYVALPGHYLLPHRDGSVYDALTGTLSGPKNGVGGLSNLVIGDRWIWLDSRSNGDRLHSSWGYRRPDGKALALFYAADVSTPTAPKPLDVKMILGDASFAAIPVMEELVPELYAVPTYGYNSWGKPMFSVHTDNCLFPHGDFLFVRTVGSLYCLGPKNAWHTPVGAPPAARTGK